ncbi:membrane protein [Rhodanobacter fulvus Jip2]|uniref:Membrane protein n=2 Tax=Rhodanobacter TaxID=75309 RepID=I4VRB7_9GAMM|nr:membrane protein [Rhodanobacter fulvus Jip2]
MVGLVVFAIAGMIGGAGSGGVFFGMVTGAVLGVLWGRQAKLRSELVQVRALLERSLTRQAAAQAPASAPATKKPIAPLATESRLDAAYADAPTPAAPPPLPASLPRPSIIAPVAPHAPVQPDAATVLTSRITRWFTEGNVPVKIGMLVLFAGVAALLKYAADAGMLHVPIALRLSAVAVAAVAALIFGWRQRDTRRGFALSLQGGAIGVLLITVFAAFRLYALLPPQAAFVVLLVLVAGVGVLAVLQDALALAVLALLAGFLAPILTSTGQGSHVALFSYYAVLNLAIFGVAWRRSWRVLNLLGFVATFGIGTAWGVLQYRPELFASTEPFLLLNFLFYLAIPLLYLRHAEAERSKVIDGCLVFGTPLVSLLLQGALLQWQAQPLAFSALAAAVIYVAVAWSVRGREHLGILRDAWAALAIALATLAVPLALSASLTGSVFALEGAGLVWLGFRQQRWLSRWAGVALQGAAAFAVVIGYGFHYFDHAPATVVSWLDRDFLSALILVIAAFASASFYARMGNDGIAQRRTAVLLYGWGLCWWLGDCVVAIGRHISYASEPAALMLLLIVTAWACAEVARHHPRFELGTMVAWTAPALFVVIGQMALGQLADGTQPLLGWNLLATVVGALLGWRTLTCLREWAPQAVLGQWSWLWRWTVIASAAIKVALPVGGDWRLLLVMLPPCALAWLALARPRWIALPLPALMPRLRGPLLYSAFLVLGIYGFTGLFMAGDTAPMPYLPLLNPLELLLIVILLLGARWLGDASAPATWRSRRAVILGAVGMAFVTSATLRAAHQLGGVPWSEDALFHSSLAQMALTLVWSVFGLFAWVWGSRRGQRWVWLAGAVAMGVVLAKLLLIDRGHLGNLFGIASFIAYGLLCTVIGYLAPAPPRQLAAAES